MQQKEDQIQIAVALYNAQVLLPEEERLCIDNIAKSFSIPYMTLHNRISGTHNNHDTAARHLQLLTNEEETSLVDYIKRMSLSGNPPPVRTIRELACVIQQNRLDYDPIFNPPPPPVSSKWINRFRKRHPEVQTAWSRALNTCRVKGTAPEKLAPFYAELGILMEKNQYLPSNIHNS
ncbi:uncharacterized protein I206_102792 [Kwoniella pini CBS 10737]|uniref:HTH CENPB-type domain-containing protein n=1 Tax=Kwoniella pini CBS 10737 TaxID=1296096 RepID=A0AAJ8MNP6_9TREE